MVDYQGEKFERYIRRNNLAVSNVAEKLSVNRQTVYKYFASKNLTREVVSNITTKLGVTEDEIWGIQAPVRREIGESKVISLADPQGEYRTGEKIYELPDGQKVMEVKIVPAKGQAGYLVGFPDPEYYEDLPTLPINVNGNHRGNYLAFEVRGDSMTPDSVKDFQDAILEGWHVVGRELPRHHWSYKLHTHSHSFWIIVHKRKGILIKQIKEHNVEKGTIKIHSLNPAYEDEVLNLDDIAQIFSGIKRIINDR